MIDYIIYMIVCILQPICWPLPEMSTILYGTIKFGPIKSFIMGYVFILLGIALMYKITFFLSEKYLTRIKSKNKFLTFKRYVEKNEVLTIGILFVLPILPDEIICVGAAILEIKFKVVMFVAVFAKFISIGMISFSEIIASTFEISKISVIIFELVIVFIASIAYSKYKIK